MLSSLEGLEKLLISYLYLLIIDESPNIERDIILNGMKDNKK